MDFEAYILPVFPILALFILFFKSNIYKGEINADAWSHKQSKNLQAIAAIMIIIHHLVQTVTDYGRDYKGPITEFNSFGILFTSIFFFFSGFGLYKSFKNKEGYLNGFLLNRMPQVVIPFMVTNLLYFITQSVYRISSPLDVTTAFWGLTLINTNAWFIVEIIVLYMAFYLIFKNVKNEKKAFVLMDIFVAVMVVISLLTCHDTTQINGHYFMGEWWYNTTAIFIMGLYAGRYENRLKEFLTKKWPLKAAVFLALLAGWYFLEEFVLDNFGYYQEWRWHPGYPEKFLTLIAQTVLCVLFMIFVLLINLKISFDNKILGFLGTISLELYLVHDVFRQRLYNGKMMDFVYFAVVMAGSLIGAYMLHSADESLIEYFGRRRTWLSFKMPKGWDEDMSYEAKKMALKELRIIRVVEVVYIVMAVAFVACLMNTIVYRTAIIKQESIDEKNALANAKVGDVVYFGRMEFNDESAHEDHMPWIVLDIKDGHYLLLSQKVLADSYYNDKHMDTDWKESRLCRILNIDFYRGVFSRYEKPMVCSRYDETTGTWYNDEHEALSYFLNTSEKYNFEDVKVSHEMVFILSKEETERYLPDEKDRIAYVTEILRKWGYGADRGDGSVATWWICDRGEKEISAMYVKTDGSIDTVGKVMNNTGAGVRPAIWVDINK